MKNLLSILSLLALLVFGGCKKDDEVEPIPTGDIDLGIFKITKDPTSGKAVKSSVNCTIWMWNSDGHDFDINGSGSELYLGRILDKNTKTYVSADFGAIGINMKEKVKTGNYLVYVVINKSDLHGSQAYSYKFVEIKKDEKVSIRKVFSQDVGTLQYEDWDKNK